MDHLARRLIFGDDENDGSDSGYPSGWFVIPIVGVIALGCVITLLRYRRRKLRLALAGYRNNALRRDIDAMGPRPWYMTRSAAAAGHRREGATGPAPAASGRYEGLNEFGEAPPAYTARHNKQPGVDDIELGHIGRSQADVPPPPPAVAAPVTTTAVTTAPEPSNPPPYNDAQQQGDTVPPQDGPERPPPAVLSSR